MMSLFWPFHSSVEWGGYFPDQGHMRTHNTWWGIPSCAHGVCVRPSIQTRRIATWRDGSRDAEADAHAKTQTHTWRHSLRVHFKFNILWSIQRSLYTVLHQTTLFQINCPKNVFPDNFVPAPKYAWNLETLTVLYEIMCKLPYEIMCKIPSMVCCKGLCFVLLWKCGRVYKYAVRGVLLIVMTIDEDYHTPVWKNLLPLPKIDEGTFYLFLPVLDTCMKWHFMLFFFCIFYHT